MPCYQLVSCRIKLGGDPATIVHRGKFNPLSLPALMIVEHLHGSENVTHVEHAGWTEDIPSTEMFQRLIATYRKEHVAACFPGARPRLPVSDAGIPQVTRDEKEPVAREPDPVHGTGDETIFDDENPFGDETETKAPEGVGNAFTPPSSALSPNSSLPAFRLSDNPELANARQILREGRARHSPETIAEAQRTEMRERKRDYRARTAIRDQAFSPENIVGISEGNPPHPFTEGPHAE